MTSLSQRLTRLELAIRPGEVAWSFMDRYNEIHQIALKRLSPADRILCEDLPRLSRCPSNPSLTDDQQQAERRWVAAFDSVASEISPSFSVGAYDVWL